MQWYHTVFEVIDMRSFSNLWFWIALAVVWSSASHWVLGVPYDMVLRARRHGGQAQTDLEDLVRINVNRLLYIGRVSGMWLIGLAGFVLAMLFVLGFFYRIEFCQALFLIGFPLSLVGGASLYSAGRIAAGEAGGPALYRRLHRQRLVTQVIGMVAIFITAMWGMFQNLNTSVLGG